MTTSLEKKLMALVVKAQQWLKAYATLPPDLQAEKKQAMQQLQQLVTAHQALLGEDKPTEQKGTVSKDTKQLFAYYQQLTQQLPELLAS